MSDDIRRELTENLERYQQNAVLNKLTPNRRTASDLPSSLRHLTRSSSRRTTPGRLGRRPGHNDSNIVTSPVKTLRRYRTVSSDEEEEVSARASIASDGIVNGSITVSVPLRDSPKQPLRKGTPKALSAKSSKKSPVKLDIIYPPLQTQQSKSFTMFREVVKLPTGAATQAGDDYGDDNDIYGASNDTLLSDIPSDLLSPEKHVYPQENLTSSKTKQKPRPKTSIIGSGDNEELVIADGVITPSPQKSKGSPRSRSMLYPDLGHLISSAGETPSEKHTEPRKGSPDTPVDNSNGVSVVKSSSVVERTVGDAQVKSSLYPNLDQTSMATKPIESSTKTLKPPSPIEPHSIASHDPVDNESSEPPSQPLSTHSPIVPKLPPFPYRSPRRTSHTSRLSQEDSPLRSPARRLPTTSTTLSEPPEHRIHTLTASNQKKTKRIGSLDLTQFDSSDEEPLPELTVPIDMSQVEETSTVVGMKRSTNEFAELETERSPKKQKTFSIYPDNPNVEALVIKEEKDQPSKVRSKTLNNTVLKDIHPTSLYPSLLSPPPQEQKKTESTETETDGKEDLALGDAENWTEPQWTEFISCFEKFEKNGHDFAVFNSKVLQYLRCDSDEILLKIGFYKEFLDEQEL